jgi:zinc protease
MFKDKKPGKWALLAVLFLIVLIAILIFFGLSAKASGEKFLPVTEMKTPGGITVWTVEDKSLPIVAVKFLFKDSGSANDPDDKQGLARLLSNTMDEGAGDLGSEAFQKALADNSITLQFEAGRDSFGGTLKALTRNQDKAFELLTLAINAPRFDEEPVARMRDGNLTRIKSALSDPDWMAARLINDKAFSGHPYAKNSGGTLSSLPSITPADLRKFKETYLTQDRLLISAAGDINPATLASAIDKAFGKLPKSAPVNAIKNSSVTNGGKIYLYEQPIPQTMIQIMLPAFDRKDKDYYGLQMMNYIYGGAGFGSRLMENAREKKGLTYGIYSGVQDYHHTDILSITTSTKNESTNEMLSIIRAEMTRMQNEKVTDKELADAKSFIIGSMPLALDSTEDIAGMVLNLREEELPIDYLDHFADYMRAVTADDVLRVAKRVLKPETMTTALIGKPAEIKNVEVVKELPNVQ